MFLGVDCGVTGHFSIITAEYNVVYSEAFSDIVEAFNIIKKINDETKIKFATVERIWVRPNMKGMTTMISNMGHWLALIKILGLKYTDPAPVTWQKAMFGKIKAGTTKLHSVALANKYWPELRLKEATDHDKADSLNIALYGMKLFTNQL